MLFGDVFVKNKLRSFAANACLVRKQVYLGQLFRRGSVRWSCYDLFAGVQCGRKALEFIQAAAEEKWGVVSKISFGFMAL